MSGAALLEAWRNETDMDRRDELYEQLVEANFFPKEDIRAWETGLYPEYDDPEFSVKILSKREFQESKQTAPLGAPGTVSDAESDTFELSPVQRFVSRFINPRTPYNSALLYHGVGVGKTCAAVTIAESYLEVFPRKKIFLTAPPTIQAGFKSEIFNFGADTFQMTPEGEPNHHKGCTGQTYLELTNSVYEKTRTTIEARIATKINSRYEFFGYTQLYKFILKIMSRVPKGLTGEERTMRENIEIRREFSGRVLIIDEAHNLRDLPDESADDNLDAPDLSDTADAAAGKRLTPYLQRVLDIAEGMTLVLLTATPMYNSYREIIFLLNLLLRNDKRARLNEADIFYTSGARAGQFKPGGEALLGRVAGCYVSYMRGENPFAFPVRLPPSDDVRIEAWAETAPNGEVVPELQAERCLLLPTAACSMSETTESQYKEFADFMMEEGRGGLGIANVDALIQAGNFIFPSSEEGADIRGRYGTVGFEQTFKEEKKGSDIVYTTVEEDASWLRADELRRISGKAAFLVEQLRTSRGVSFIYSRFVASGALMIALCLEANGYTAWGRDTGLLGNGIQAPGGRQCAYCEKKEAGHSGDHAFVPAKYVLLTGSEKLSLNNAAAIKAARAVTNKNGGDIKVILGSQIAGEGLNLRFIRELYVFDSWFHLNKLEQVIGRGVRTQSHALLEEEKRNCTVYLLINTYKNTPDEETIDMYSYRKALEKAIQMGKVTRVLKRYAIDCSLNYGAIRITGLPARNLLDSQGVMRENVDVNDIEFSPICDWIECDYACAAHVDMPLQQTDTSTYDEYSAKWRIAQIKKSLVKLFERRTFLKLEDLESIFGNIPRVLLGTILTDIVTNKSFTIYTPRGEGRLVFRNGYYLFQPLRLEKDPVPIPLAVRMSPLPVKRDSFEPRLIEAVPPVVEEKVDVEDGEKGGRESGDFNSFWTACVEWMDQIASGAWDGSETLPADVASELKAITAGNAKLLRQRTERLEMISWFHPVLTETPVLQKEFAKIFGEYIWDEFLNYKTQKDLYFSEDEKAKAAAPRSTVWELEGVNYIRLYDGEKGEIETFADGEVASKAVLEILEESADRDPIRSRPIRPASTGSQYGFIVKKKQDMIFKIAIPPLPGKKVERGARCSIDSNISYQIGKLVELGAILSAMKVPTLGLDEHTLTKVRPFKNSTRACTLLDLVLRWMDLRRIGGKRWFYRPLEAALLGHKAEA